MPRSSSPPRPQASYERTVRDWQAAGPNKKAGASVTAERA